MSNFAPQPRPASRLGRRNLLFLFAILGLLGSLALIKLARRASADTNTAVSISSFGTAVTQDFNTLVSSGTGTLAANTPAGWGFSESGTNANSIYTAGTGSNNAGDTYSYGSTAVPGDRALGQLRSGSLISVLGGTFQNNTGGTITSLSVSYVGEEWRFGAAHTTVAERMDFQYSTDATSLTTGTWVDVNALDFNPPNTTGPIGPLDGNAGPNRSSVSSTITGLSIANGTNFWIRWTDVDATGADDGLAVDDFSITANGGDAAPTVVSTTPANGATNVPVNSNVVINFSESVNATASAFSIQCGSPQSFSQSSSPSSSFTLTPTSALPFNTLCTVTVTATQITDQDVIDPPDQMASNHVFSFTTAGPADTAPTVVSTTPANLATNVAIDSNIVINFSESVTASASAFSVQCPTGSPQSFAQSASPNATFTLNPNSDLPYSTTCTVTVTAAQISDTDSNDPPDQMASDYSFSFTTANAPATNIIINEVDADTAGTDAAEFVELYDGGVGNTPLNGLVVVFYNGSNDLSYASFNLSGSTNANGYYTLGNSGVPGVDQIFGGNFLQNGADAVALYVGNASSFPNGTAITTANLLDAIVYDNGQADDTGLLPLLNAGQPQVDEGGASNSIGRCPNGTGGGRNTSTYAQGAPSSDGPNSCATPPPPNTVVLSQVYGGGGNTGATLKNDFIELINHSSAPVNLNGWSVQAFVSTSSTWEVTPLPNFILQPGQYFLIQESQGAGGTDNLPTPDAIGTIAVSSTSTKVALVNNTTQITAACPNAGAAGIVDLVGYGGTDCFEGSAPAPATVNTIAVQRRYEGCFDTNDNSHDFVTGTPSPRNSTTPFHDCTALTAYGTANPVSVLQGESTTLTVYVAAGQNPASTGLSVTADLSQIGGSPTQVFSPIGNDVFTFTQLVPSNNPTGLKSLPVTITDAQTRVANATIGVKVLPLIADHITISQVYGGGGNTGASYQNDFIELYNPTNSTITITGWSLQYASAEGTSWTNKQPLGGFIGPGQYYLVKLASGTAGDGDPVPTPNISGDINISGTTGKIALVSNSSNLAGSCPISTDPDIVDFVGYGSTATCHEGPGNAPAPSNTTAIFREAAGATDRDRNNDDFTVAAPNPRQTAPIVELGPWVSGTDPGSDANTIPYDATIVVNFSEPVTVDSGWLSLTCTVTGAHLFTDGTESHFPDLKTYAFTPNTSFQFGEQCTATITKTAVHDTDIDDSGADTDTLFENYTWSFTVVGAGAAAPYPPSVHLTMGNPSGADAFQPLNFLMEKPTYTISYNNGKGTPNWVSWHLDPNWYGTLARVDTFRADPKVDPSWYRVQGFDYAGSGFDRGHMTPNADRDNQNRIPINQETYLMTNMIPQAPDNNQGPWANLEAYLRAQSDVGNEVYIVAGPAGQGGTGSNGFATTIASGHVTVPASTWKVALFLAQGSNDIARVNCSTRTLAVVLPNIQGIRNDDWANYITTVDAVEALTGYDFFSNLPEPIQRCVESGTNGNNPPLDTDADGVPDATDNCPFVANTNQANNDGDSMGDVCDPDDDNDGIADTSDNCPLAANADQADGDGDGIGNACDPNPNDGPTGDLDGDGVLNSVDNCPTTPNANQLNTDGDTQGDACDADDDNDGVLDAADNCPLTVNANQANNDGDAQGDVCDADDDNDGVPDTTDNCQFTANSDQANFDGDAFGDVCDADDDNDGVADANDLCPNTPPNTQVNGAGCPDADGDGIADFADNCPLAFNPDQANFDGDTMGDVCDGDDDNDGVSDGNDLCPNTPLNTQVNSDGCPDQDGDGVADTTDNCVSVSNADQADFDHDGLGDACDTDDDNDGDPDTADCSPLNAAINHSAAEVCDGLDNNCDGNVDEGFPDTDGDGQANCVDADDDGDSVPDATDNCPLVSNADQADNDHDGLGDACDSDDDNDGVLDAADNCSLVSNPEQSDNDHDGVGDVCDADDDNDGVPDATDNCALTANSDQADTDHDGIGDTCDADDDNDGVADTTDNCSLVANSDQADGDHDGIGDACDADDDNDGVPDATDNCPFTANPGQGDNDHDGIGDVCDSDDDNDGTPDASDNCALIANPGQADNDHDGAGDACDSDDDNDGVPDATDNCPFTVNAGQSDVDHDGIGDPCDPDDDNDGVPDTTDNCPLTPNPDQLDTNNDGVGDACTGYQFPVGGAFVIGNNVDVTNGATVYFWGSQWSQKNPMTGGSASNLFKGFEGGNPAPTCGGTWTSSPGDSSNPPATVPQYMAVIVASSIQQNGSVLSGDIQKIVIVKTNPGYGPSPGHAGTGQVVAVLCGSTPLASVWRVGDQIALNSTPLRDLIYVRRSLTW